MNLYSICYQTADHLYHYTTIRAWSENQAFHKFAAEVGEPVNVVRITLLEAD